MRKLAFPLFVFAALVGCKGTKPGGPQPSPTPDYVPARFEVGVAIHNIASERVDRVKEMGAKWVRIDINWCDMESEANSVDWSSVDAPVERARANGLMVYAHIQCTPEWAVENGQRPWTGIPKTNYWTSFVERTALRYKGKIAALGIWNEPNLSVFWTASARDYAERLVKPAGPVIRAKAPGMLVVGPDLSHLYRGTIDMQEFYDTLKQTGAADQLDVISHHIYGHEDFDANMNGHSLVKDGFKQILEKSGLRNKRIWITEFGVDSKKVGEQMQSEFVYGQITKMSDWGMVEKAFIYELDDSDTTAPHNYGLLRVDGSPKPVFQAVKDLLNP